MAKAILRVKHWCWWLGGLFCALVFGRGASAQEARAEPEYGVRVRPPAGQPAVTEEQKKKAGKLVDEYLDAELSPPEPAAELKTRIEALIKGLGVADFPKREAASAELVKIGRPALAELRRAAESKDQEVAWRAKAAIEKIGAAAVEELRSMGWVASKAVEERTGAERKAAESAEASAAEAEKADRKEEAGKFRAAARTARARVEALTRLAARVVPVRQIITHPCEMAPRPRDVAPPDPPPPPPNFRK